MAKKPFDPDQPTLDFDEPKPKKTGKNPESRGAFYSRDRSEWTKKVLNYIQHCGKHGATPDEGAAFFGVVHNRVAPVFTYLKNEGRITWIFHGEGKARKKWTRPTRLGCRAAVHVAVEFAE